MYIKSTSTQKFVKQLSIANCSGFRQLIQTSMSQISLFSDRKIMFRRQHNMPHIIIVPTVWTFQLLQKCFVSCFQWSARVTSSCEEHATLYLIPRLHDRANIEQTPSKCIQNTHANCSTSARCLLAFIQLSRRAVVISMLIRAGGL